MRKFLGYVVIAAVAVLPTAVRVSAEPPPIEPIVISIDVPAPTTCDNECQPRSGK